MRVLLEHVADANATWNEKQALYGAVVKGTVGIIDLLVANNADVDGHERNLSPLQVACQSAGSPGCCSRVSALLGHGAAIDLLDDGGNTPLHMAAISRSAEVVDLLLRAGADETVANAVGQTPADGVRSTHTSAADNDISDSVLRLLDGAPRDRVWRRRRFLVLCRAFPEKARLKSSLRTRAELPRASKRGARRWGGRRTGGGAQVSMEQNGGLNNLLTRLFRVEEDGIFRNIVCLL